MPRLAPRPHPSLPAALVPGLPAGLLAAILAGPLVGSLVGGCAAPRLAPLTAGDDLPVSYRAGVVPPQEVASAVLADAPPGAHAALFGGSLGAGTAPVEAPAWNLPAAAPDEPPVVRLRSWVLGLDRDAARDLLGWGTGRFGAFKTDRAALEARLDQPELRRRGRLRTTPEILACGGIPSTVSLVSQKAYVRDYRIDRTADGLILDPTIGTVADGVTLDVTARPAEAAVDLDVALATADLAEPLPRAQVAMPGGIRLTIQEPLLVAQRLALTTRLAPDEALVLVGLGRANSGELLFTFLTAAPYETTAPAPARQEGGTAAAHAGEPVGSAPADRARGDRRSGR